MSDHDTELSGQSANAATLQRPVGEGQSLAERLNDPKVSEGLNRLLDQLGNIAFLSQSIEGLMQRGDTIADSVSEAVNEVRPTDPAAVNHLLERAPRLAKAGLSLADTAESMDLEELHRSEVLRRLTQPEMLQQLNLLLDRLPMLVFAAEALNGFLERGDTVVESISDVVHDLPLKDLDPANWKQLLELMPKLKEAGTQLLDSGLLQDGFPQVIQAGVGMVESGMLDKKVVNTLGELGKASTETYNEVVSKPIPPVGGIFGLMRATKDPDVQKTVGFAFAFAKAFAKHIK